MDKSTTNPDSLLGKYCFVSIPGITDGRQPRRIDLSPCPGVTVPAAYRDLFSEILRTLIVLNILFPEAPRHFPFWRSTDRLERKFGEYYRKLADLSLMAFGQDQVPLGALSLKEIQNEVVEREAGGVKNGYMRVLGYWALSFIAVAGAVYLICRSLDTDTVWFRYRDIFCMLMGSFLGTWLSFGIRRTQLGFFDLTRLEDDQLDPPMRLIFVAAMTVVIGLLLFRGAIKLTVGGFDTTALLQSGADALLIGCFCGLSEKALPAALMRRSTEMLGLIAGASRQGGDTTPQPPGPR